MEFIRDGEGNIIHRSRNLAGIRWYVGGMDAPTVDKIDISEIGHGEGKLCVLFTNRTSFETNFASFQVLTQFVSRWRNVYGSPLSINGVQAGYVSSTNPNSGRSSTVEQGGQA